MWYKNKNAKSKGCSIHLCNDQQRSVKQEVEWAIIDARIIPSCDKFEKEIDFPKWQDGWSWETYKRDIKYYMEATTRKPVNQIMDMKRALKESNQGDIAARMMSKMENSKHDVDIIDKCVKWISATYGKTKYEEQCVVGKKFLNLRRDPSKDVQKFIAEFDAVMKESEAVGLILPDNWKAIILQIVQE